jgi:hypothetical protein
MNLQARNPETRQLCEYLNQTKGGFIGMAVAMFAPKSDHCFVPMDAAQQRALRGRRISPDLEYFCDLLRAGKPLR